VKAVEEVEEQCDCNQRDEQREGEGGIHRMR
jgi:hypothetical protein